MKNIILLVVCNFILFNVFSQNSWYVSETGNDTSGNGSQIAPWATITKALSEATTVNGDTIHISGTITQSGLTAGGIDILKNIVIKGETKETSIIQASENSFSATSRVFTNWSIAKIINITIKNGYFDSFSPQYGAGILNWGVLSLENCIITDNNIENSELGGGIYNEFGTLYLKDTYIYSNYSSFGGAGIVCEGGSLNIENSTIALNYTQQNLATGAGIFITDTADVNIKNSTIYYNLMGNNSYGSGICIKGDDTHIGTLSLNLLNVTIADNESGDGSFGNGIYVENNSANSVEIAIKNCIISNSNSNNYGEEGENILILRTYTLCRDATLAGDGVSGNINNTDPNIDTFENHGGNTPTASLMFSSPAINAGTDNNAPITDQRGFARVEVTDMGAFEYQTNTNINNLYENNIIQIYPNPANNRMLINLSKINYPIKYAEIINISGKLVNIFPVTKSVFSINTSKFKSGIYFIRLKTTDNYITQKFIID